MSRSDVLAHAGGRWLLGVVAVDVIAIGCYFVVKGDAHVTSTIS